MSKGAAAKPAGGADPLALTAEQLGEFKEAFNHFDRDGDGLITVKELKEALLRFGLADVKDSEVQAVIAQADPNGIEFSDFLNFVQLKMSEADNGDATLQECFNTFDSSKKGYITPEDLLRHLTLLGEKVTMTECEEMIREAAGDGDGKIKVADFKKLMA